MDVVDFFNVVVDLFSKGVMWFLTTKKPVSP